MKTEKPIVKTITKNEDTVTVPKYLLDDMMARLAKVESKDNLKQDSVGRPVDYPRDAPHEYSYKMLLQSRDDENDGEEILKVISKVSVKSDGIPGTNQVHQTAYITYADGAKDQISYELYAKTVRYSDRKFATETVIKNGKKSYTFDHNGESVTIEESAIN